MGYQVFDTSDLPGGVVNILTGDRDHVTKYLAEHQNLDAMWYFGSPEGSNLLKMHLQLMSKELGSTLDKKGTGCLLNKVKERNFCTILSKLKMFGLPWVTFLLTK